MKKSKAVFTTIGILAYALFGSSSAVMADCNHATYSFSTEVLHIPRVDVPDPITGLVSTYNADLKVRSGGDFVFELVSVAPASGDEDCNGSVSVYTEITSSDVEGILDEMNLEYESKTTSDGDPLLVVTLGSYKAVIVFYDCSGSGCQSLGLMTGFSMSNSPTLSLINEWNSSKRYATAFLDSDNDPWISADLDIAGGVSSGAIERFITRFKVSILVGFTDHIGFRSRRNDYPTSDEEISKAQSYNSIVPKNYQ